MNAFYRRYGKRCFDLAALAAAAPVALPLLAIILTISFVILGRPVLFRQRRAGLGGRSFLLNKFRSMQILKDASGRLLPDEERSTRYGRFLRSTSLDELPELWNVLRGDMSLIGPRPLPTGYEDHYTAEQSRRLEARPGLAGYAALFGRNAQSWERIFERDVWYVNHVSFAVDLRIIFGVARVVLSRTGIDRGEHNRDSEFQRRLEHCRSRDTYAAHT